MKLAQVRQVLNLKTIALKTAIKAIEIAEKIQDDEGLMKGNQILSKIYEKTGI